MQYISHYVSPIGNITLSSDGISITGLWFDLDKDLNPTDADVAVKYENNVLKEYKYTLNLSALIQENPITVTVTSTVVFK